MTRAPTLEGRLLPFIHREQARSLTTIPGARLGVHGGNTRCGSSPPVSRLRGRGLGASRSSVSSADQTGFHRERDHDRGSRASSPSQTRREAHRLNVNVEQAAAAVLTSSMHNMLWCIPFDLYGAADILSANLIHEVPGVLVADGEIVYDSKIAPDHCHAVEAR